MVTHLYTLCCHLRLLCGREPVDVRLCPHRHPCKPIGVLVAYLEVDHVVTCGVGRGRILLVQRLPYKQVLVQLVPALMQYQEPQLGVSEQLHKRLVVHLVESVGNCRGYTRLVGNLLCTHHHHTDQRTVALAGYDCRHSFTQALLSSECCSDH